MNRDKRKNNRSNWLFLLLVPVLFAWVKVQQASANAPGTSADPWIDITDRQVVNDFYYTNFLPSQNNPMDWSGDYDSCDPGDTSTAYKNSVLMQVNYFRAMAGVPASVTFNETYNQKAQQAALMMSVNGDLNHTPPTDWTCYTAEGAEAAGSSNLGMSYGGIPFEVGNYINEHLSSVGHRLWILYPQTQQMGTGDVPESYPPFPMANALWVFDDHIWDPRPTTRDEFVAWPSPGYVPHPMVPDLWSISPTDTDFITATVTMTMDGSPVDITHTFAYGCSSMYCAPEPVIVWVPDVNWATLDLSSDVVFHVEVVVQFENSPDETIDYNVILFAPFDGPPTALPHKVYLPAIMK